MIDSTSVIHKPTPELRDRLKKLVVDSLVADESKRAYGRYLDNFFDWFEAERPATGFSRATILSYRTTLLRKKCSSSTVNLNLTALRRLASEAADNRLMSSEDAASIARIRGVKRHGLRIGKRLTIQEAEKLMDTPDPATLKGKRDRAILAILIGCGLRRDEIARLRIEHIEQREGRWMITDMLGKGGRIRSIPMPVFAKAALDTWLQAAELRSGRVFRAVNKGGSISGKSISGQAVFEMVTQYSAQSRLNDVTPHDLRRTFARLAHNGKSSLEQIQLSLGHHQIATTTAYVGIQQDLTDAPCDHLGLGRSDSSRP
jgi:integrase/recombinase XerD